MAFAFRLIADTGDRFCDFRPYVASVNDAGMVAFHAVLRTESCGVFTSDGAQITTVIDTAGGIFGRVDSHPDINNNGAVSFYAGLKSGSQGVFLIDGGRPITIAEDGGPLARIGPLGPTMNDEGTVAFRANLPDGGAGIFSGRAERVVAIARASGRFSGFQGLPVINNKGTVVFRADLPGSGEGGRSQGIYTGNGRALATIAETGDVFSDLALFPDMNEAGTVAFCATLKAGGAGVFAVRDGAITPLVAADAGFESFRGVFIHRAGLVAFAATPTGGRLSLYVGPDSIADRVISLGDPLLGSTVTGFALNPVSVNEASQLAIRVSFANQRQAIIRVDPNGGMT